VDSPLVEAQAVERRFGRGLTEVHAVRGVDLAIRPGEVHVITGPSGSGKSTLLYLLGSLDRPSVGAVRFLGVDVATMSERDRAHLRRHQVGFVFQSHRLLPVLTALENVLVPAIPSGATAADIARARALLERVGLTPRLDHRPAELSGGEQQRVALARALLMRPRLVLADEPTGELDSATGAGVIRALRELAHDGSTAVLMVTHDHGLLASGDWHHRMRDGRIESCERVASAPGVN